MLLAREPFPIWVLPALVVAFTSLVVIAVKVGRRRDRKRLAALTGVAAELGLQFVPSDQKLLAWWDGYAVSPRGDRPMVTSVMWGTRDVPIIVFDYTVRIGSDKNKSWLRRTVTAFDLNASPLPVFAAEGLEQTRFSRFLDRNLGEKSIDFPDDVEFSRTFNVRGAEVDSIRRVMNAAVRAYLLARSTWTIRSTGRWLLISWRGDRPKPEDYRAYIDEMCEGMRVLAGKRA